MASVMEHAWGVPKFSGNNFTNWLFRIKCLMDEKDCKEVIEKSDDDIKKLSADFKSSFNKMDAKARNIIVSSLSDSQLEYVKNETTAKDMIVNLKKIYERKSTLSNIYLRKQLITLKCKPNEGLAEHFHNFYQIISNLESGKTKLEEADKVTHLLLSLPDKYDSIITALETTNETLTIDYVKSKLLDAELKLKNGQEKGNNASNEHSFLSERNGSFNCFKCGKANHYARNCTVRGRGSFRGRNRGGRNRRPSAMCNSHETPEENDKTFTFIAYAASATENNTNITFAIDSGATYNMIQSQYEKYMTEVIDIPEIVIKIANKDNIIVSRKGLLNVYAENGSLVKIEALIINQLSHNLLSVRKMNDKGYKVIFNENIAVICKNNQQIQGRCNGSLYLIKFSLKTENALITENKNLWHMRMGHLNHAGMKIMGLPFSDEKCDTCIKAKGTRNPFKDKSYPRTNKIGELIYCDIGGPIQPLTENNEKYYLTIIDDYSHFTEVYTLKNKSEAKQYLINYINKLNNNYINVKRIRTDNGGEFTSEDFKTFCQSRGIIQEFTCAYTPQQNGVAERMNRTLLDRVRAMLIESNLPKYLWGEGIRCAAYTLNRSPTVALRGKTPAGIFLGKGSLDNLRIFGSKAWAINLPRQGKLEPRAKEARMTGYSPNGYRLWDPNTGEIFISRDVKFDENDYRYTEESNKMKEVNETSIHYINDRVNIMETGTQPELGETEIGQTEIREAETKQPDCQSIQLKEQTNAQDEYQRKRAIKLPRRYDEYELYMAHALITEDPNTYEEAIQKSAEWKDAINKEIKSLEELDTWIETKLPTGKKTIDTKWVFRTKPDGSKKARLVARGYQQETECNIYSPVAKMSTIRLSLSVALNNDWEIRQLDIPTAFLNGDLNTEVYIEIPKGVKVKNQENVLKLQKALYGLKEAPRCWNERFNKFCEEKIKLQRSKYDVCLYVGENIWLILFVDDILLMGKLQEINKIVQDLTREFKAKDMGNITTFLGIEIIRNKNNIQLSQKKFISKLLEKYNMSQCKEVKIPMETGFCTETSHHKLVNVPYRELIGCLNYLAMISRPDIIYATSYLSRYLDKPTNILWKTAKRIIRYLKGTINMVLTFRKCSSSNPYILAFSDADWAGDKNDRKSTSGMVIYHGDNLISWSSKKQSVVALSTAEAEYVAAALCITELLYLKGLTQEFQGQCNVVLKSDNQSAIKMMNNYENTKRSKHIDIKVHFIKDIVAKGLISVEFVESENNIADMCTKPLSFVKFSYFREKMLN